jgi:hypothetical protein
MMPACKCGSLRFFKDTDKLNCRGCGVLAIKTQENLYIFGLALKEDQNESAQVSPQA